MRRPNHSPDLSRNADCSGRINLLDTALTAALFRHTYALYREIFLMITVVSQIGQILDEIRKSILLLLFVGAQANHGGV